MQIFSNIRACPCPRCLCLTKSFVRLFVDFFLLVNFVICLLVCLFAFLFLFSQYIISHVYTLRRITQMEQTLLMTTDNVVFLCSSHNELLRKERHRFGLPKGVLFVDSHLHIFTQLRFH